MECFLSLSLTSFLFSCFEEIKTKKVLLCSWYPHPKERNRYPVFRLLQMSTLWSYKVSFLMSQESRVWEYVSIWWYGDKCWMFLHFTNFFFFFTSFSTTLSFLHPRTWTYKQLHIRPLFSRILQQINQAQWKWSEVTSCFLRDT